MLVAKKFVIGVRGLTFALTGLRKRREATLEQSALMGVLCAVISTSVAVFQTRALAHSRIHTVREEFSKHWTPLQDLGMVQL